MDVTELFFFGGIAEKAADLSDTRYQGTGILKLIPGIRQEYFVFKNTLLGRILLFGGLNTFNEWVKYFQMGGDRKADLPGRPSLSSQRRRAHCINIAGKWAEGERGKTRKLCFLIGRFTRIQMTDHQVVLEPLKSWIAGC